MSHVDFIVYGPFIEPSRSENFIIVRMPEGRVPWSKQIVPAIHKLVRSFYEATDDPAQRRLNKDVKWYVGGDPDEPETSALWIGKHARYEWTPENGLQAVQEDAS